MAGPGIEPGISGSWVRRATDCATRPGVYSVCVRQMIFLPEFGWLVVVVVVVDLLFYIHGKHLRSCRDGQLT